MSDLFGTIWELFVVGTFLYVIRKGLGDWIYGKITKSERRTAIWDHYMAWAKGEGGHTAEVLDCHAGKCVTL